MEETHVILNPQMKLFLELGVDSYCGNLPTKYKVAIIILDEYKQGEFCDIV